jgi:hypothetical protein
MLGKKNGDMLQLKTKQEDKQGTLTPKPKLYAINLNPH